MIEVFQPSFVLGNQDDVFGLPVRVALFPQGRHGRIDLLETVNIQLRLQPLEKVGQEQAAGGGVIAGTVVLERREAQVLRYNVQLILAQLRKQVLG